MKHSSRRGRASSAPCEAAAHLLRLRILRTRRVVANCDTSPGIHQVTLERAQRPCILLFSEYRVELQSAKLHVREFAIRQLTFRARLTSLLESEQVPGKLSPRRWYGAAHALRAFLFLLMLTRAVFAASEHQTESRSSESARADCG